MTRKAPTAATAKSAESGRHFKTDGLPREIVQQHEPHRLILPDAGHEFVATPRRRFERDQLGQALNGLRRVGAEFTQSTAGGGREAVDAPPAQHRRTGGIGQERQQCQGERPGNHGERHQHRTGDQHRDEGGRDRVGVEILDCLHILGRQRDQVAGATLQQVGRGKRIELAVKIDSHHG